jgi:hypothetical protein
VGYSTHNKTFKETQAVEKEGMPPLIAFMEQISFEGNFISTNKLANCSKYAQKTLGDFIVDINPCLATAVEIKTEVEKKYPNLFLEMWSNLQETTPGWMITCKADLLWYFFQKDGELYQIDLHMLKKWAFQDGKLFTHPLKKQSKYLQKNDTWGYCVPIETLQKELKDGILLFLLGEDGFQLQ